MGGVIDQLARWYLGGTFRPRTDETDWCRHIVREFHKAADTHANCLMDIVILDLERSGQRLISPKNCRKHIASWCLSMAQDGRAAWVRLPGYWLRDETGSFQKIAYAGRVLRNISDMTVERESMRTGIKRLKVLFPTKVRLFDFKIESSGRTVQYKIDAQSLRLFGHHDDVNDVYRAGANRLQNKQTVLEST